MRGCPFARIAFEDVLALLLFMKTLVVVKTFYSRVVLPSFPSSPGSQSMANNMCVSEMRISCILLREGPPIFTLFYMRSIETFSTTGYWHVSPHLLLRFSAKNKVTVLGDYLIIVQISAIFLQHPSIVNINYCQFHVSAQSHQIKSVTKQQLNFYIQRKHGK